MNEERDFQTQVLTRLAVIESKIDDYKNIKEKIVKLLDVKSIVTIILTLVVAYLAIIGKINIEQIYLMVIAFYFGTQHQKNVDRGGE